MCLGRGAFFYSTLYHQICQSVLFKGSNEWVCVFFFFWGGGGGVVK